MKSLWNTLLREPARATHKIGILALLAALGGGAMLLQQGWNSAPTVASVRGSGTIASVLGDTSKLTKQQKFFLPVAEQLLAQGADAAFVKQLIHDSNLAFYEKLTKINVAVRPPEPKPIKPKKHVSPYDYAHNDLALRKASEFILANDSLLRAAERQHNVPKEAIASIMWVETRFGDFLGNYHVPSVYMSYAMTTQPDFLQKNKDRLKADFSAYHEKLFTAKVEKGKELTTKDTADVLEKWANIEDKMMEKANKKATWAIGELLALQQMRTLSPVPIQQLRGSWAGAFGLSQFIPSSYVKIAIDGNGDGKVNLFDVRDAAHSVGRYLSTAGWGANKKSQHRAVYHYNHSDDYVNAVLGLTNRLTKAHLSALPKVAVHRAAEKN
jgi:membrane-bound lytic murein transglycosylase B